MASDPHFSVAGIMRAGEWRSRALFAYIRPQDVVASLAVEQVLEASDAEDEHAAIEDQ